MVDVEKNNDYASKGVAGTGLGLGIAGTALGLLNGGLGVLGNGGNARTSAAADVAIPSMVGILAGLAGNRESCSENTGVNRYELSQNEKMAQKDMEIAYWRGQDETNRKISDAYSKLESRIIGLSAEVRANKDEQARNQPPAGRLQRHEHRCDWLYPESGQRAAGHDQDGDSQQLGVPRLGRCHCDGLHRHYYHLTQSIVITTDDVKVRATFFCDLIDTTTRTSLLG